MQRIDGRFVYSASDLNAYLECKRLTELRMLVARGALVPAESDDPQGDLIRRKGDEHERRYLDELRALHAEQLISIDRVEPSIEAYRAAEARTLDAMRSGARIIYQATFFDETFVGHADFLRRIEVPSALGAWSYEVLDTKLAMSAKAYFVLQVCNYSEHLQRLQGLAPERASIVLGGGDELAFRLNDYAAYYRHLKAAFLAFAERAQNAGERAPSAYPYECEHCRICVWNDACRRRRVDDDHLSLVAWMRRDQIAKFEAAGIATVAALAAAGDDARPSGMSADTFVNLRRQAALQVRGRSDGPTYELLAHEAPLGFAALPQPSPADVFFDMEGDPLYAPGRGLEYLFGCWMPAGEPNFRAFWALDVHEERTAFEAFVDFIVDRLARHPAMHVYHYAPYEKVALRRLAQMHGTREDAVDALLRGEVLVDLYAVVRQALAISEERYSIKNLERFYPDRLQRATGVKKGDQSIIMFERWMLERDEAILRDIEAYNCDDCRSTFVLREWLLERRSEAVERFGHDLPFRTAKSPPEQPPAAAAGDRDERAELQDALLRDVLVSQTQAEYAAMSEDRRSRYLMANLLAYHRREEKPAWWEFFDRCENADTLVEFDRHAIGGLRLDDREPPQKDGRSWVYAYTFPDQPHKMDSGNAADPRTRESAGTILDVDDDRNRLRLRWTAPLERARELHELIPRGPLPTGEQQAALARIAHALLDGRLAAEHPATSDLLASRAPRLRPLPQRGVLQPAVVTAESVSEVIRAIDRSCLFVQGPPGSGKSTNAAHAICDLLQAGQRVAVNSTGHRAMHELLRKIEQTMVGRGGAFRGLYKHNRLKEASVYRSPLETPFIASVDANEPFARLEYQLAGGTAWLFARPEFTGAFDYVFIDEAGQVSLADALAVSTCARNVVLLGDPSQLAQVSQGAHPPHVGNSVLAHLLGDAHTVPPDRGIFLNVSHRMQPEICAFISESMYDGRLQPAPDTRRHCVTVGDRTYRGLCYVPVEHEDNGSSSVEEADRIVAIAGELLRGSPVPSVIVVTPYNAQRRLISRKLDAASLPVEVGTVDKFQGREADVVFYSMAASSGGQIPRSAEFLFERNRFNVALSRARALSVLVCSPHLLDLACRTPEQMALVNLLCAFAERAQPWYSGSRA